MGPGETDGDERADRPLLPRADRVWRHPSEVAFEARQVATRRRRRRHRRVGASLMGVTGAAALIWLTQAGPTDVAVTADIARVGPGPGAAATTSLVAALVDFDPGPEELVLVRAADSAETLAGAHPVRAGYLVTSGQAVGDASEVLVSWGAHSTSGAVIGHDPTTDIAVIRLADDLDPAAGPDADEVVPGDVVRIVLQSGDASHQTVVEPASATAKADGAPIVGVVELAGRIGEIVPGSPAYDENGAVVGVATATADDAPAALVPIEVVRSIADDIIDHGVVTHTWLGVRARTADLDQPGSLVTAVTDDGPAARGGIEIGDVIVAVGRMDVDSMESMVAALRAYEPGSTVSVRLDRAGTEITCVVSLDSVDRAA